MCGELDQLEQRDSFSISPLRLTLQGIVAALLLHDLPDVLSLKPLGFQHLISVNEPLLLTVTVILLPLASLTGFASIGNLL